MIVCKEKESFDVADKSQLVAARKRLSVLADETSMSTMKQTELRTAATELLTNMIRYGGGGKMTVEKIEHEQIEGIRATFEDEGPGIADVEAALSKGFSTSKSLGHGLSGCRNLVDSFDLDSELGRGTRIVITKWC